MNFGRTPQVAVNLTARQIDLDRLARDAAVKRLPFETARSLAQGLADWPFPAIPVRLGVSFDSVMAGGSTLTGLRGEVARTESGWAIADLEFRAPGATLLQVAGRLDSADRNVGFEGPVKVDSGDPAVFLAWIEGLSAPGRSTVPPMQAAGTLSLARERIAVENLTGNMDRKPLDGRLAYRFTYGDKPARLEVTLRAGDLDIDRGIAIGEALVANATFDRPGEIALVLDVGHAVYSGVEARQASASLSYDATGFDIKQLSIADIGGASIDASGRIDGLGAAARGSLALNLVTPKLEDAALLADRFFPEMAETIRRYGSRTLPLRVTGKVDVEPQQGVAGRTAAKFRLAGKAAGIDINLDGSGTGDLADPAAAAIAIQGHLEAAEASRLAAFLGLDALVNAGAKPAQASFTISGTAEHGFNVDGKFAAGSDVAATAVGTLKPSGSGGLDISLVAADARLPRRGGAVPVDLKSHVTIDGGTVRLGGLAGKLGGADVKGDLALGIGEPIRIDGTIAADQVNAAELAALFTGTPRMPPRPGQAADWPTDPFALAAIPALEGRIAFRTDAARFAALTARGVTGSLRFGTSGFALSDVAGKLAEGRLALDADVSHSPAGIALKSHLKLTGADLPALFAGVARAPAAGRISLDAEVEGQGLSAAALIGGLRGNGTVMLEQAEIAGLDPAAINAVIGAMERDRTLASKPGRVAEIANASLDAGRLRLPFAIAPLVVTDGRLQVINFATSSKDNTDIAGTISLGLYDRMLDARLVLTARSDAPGERPRLGVAVRGILALARRSTDVAPLVSWVTLQHVEQATRRLDEAEEAQRRAEQKLPESPPDPARRFPDGSSSLAAGSAHASAFGSAGNLPTELKPRLRRVPLPPQPPRAFNLLDWVDETPQ
jgi:hypothetical protein